jgi:hypothetical protein
MSLPPLQQLLYTEIIRRGEIRNLFRTMVVGFGHSYPSAHYSATALVRKRLVSKSITAEHTIRLRPIRRKDMTPTLIGLDPGAGAVKALTAGGTLLMLSAVATDSGQQLANVAGLRSRKRPLRVQTAEGQFFVGAGAHESGRPVENMDFDRLTGAPEMRALLYGALTKLFDFCPPAECDLIIGLPIAALSGPTAQETVKAVKAFFGGDHQWNVEDGQELATIITAVSVTGQPVGALFEFFLDERGQPRPEHQAFYHDEVGVVNVGMSTVDLLATRRGQPVDRFVGGESIGARRLLSLMNPNGAYSLHEMDARLRDGHLSPNGQTDVWAREVFGFIDERWGSKAAGRFKRVVITGGGALLLRDHLLRKFGGRIYMATDPVMATATGLYRYGLSLSQAKKK